MMSRFAPSTSDCPRVRASRAIALATTVLVATIAGASTVRAEPPTITRVIRHHFSTVQHFPPDEGSQEICPASVTEYATGKTHGGRIDSLGSTRTTAP